MRVCRLFDCAVERRNKCFIKGHDRGGWGAQPVAYSVAAYYNRLTTDYASVSRRRVWVGGGGGGEVVLRVVLVLGTVNSHTPKEYLDEAVGIVTDQG